MSWTPNFEDAFPTTNLEQHQSENITDGAMRAEDILEQLAELDGRMPSDPFVSIIQISFDDTDDGDNDSVKASRGGGGGGQEEHAQTKQELLMKKKKRFHLLSKLKWQLQEQQKQLLLLQKQKMKEQKKKNLKKKQPPPPPPKINIKKIQSSVSKGGNPNTPIVKKEEEVISSMKSQLQPPPQVARGRSCIVTVTTTDAAALMKEVQPVEQRSTSSASRAPVATATDISMSSGEVRGERGGADADAADGAANDDVGIGQQQQSESKHDKLNLDDTNGGDGGHRRRQQDAPTCSVTCSTNSRFLSSVFSFNNNNNDDDGNNDYVYNAGTFDEEGNDYDEYDDLSTLASTLYTSKTFEKEHTRTFKICGTADSSPPMAIQLMKNMRTTTVPRSNVRQSIHREDSIDCKNKVEDDGDDGVLLDDIREEPIRPNSKKTTTPSSPSDLWYYLMRKDGGLFSNDDDDDETLGSLSLVPLTKNQHLGSLIRDVSAVEVVLNKKTAFGRFQQHRRYRSELANAQTKGSNVSTELVFANFKPDKKKALRKLSIPFPIRGLGSSFARKSVSNKDGECQSKPIKGFAIEKPTNVLDECTIQLQPHHGHQPDDVDTTTTTTTASGSTKSETTTIVTDVLEEKFDTNGTRLHCWNVTCQSNNVKDRRNCIISIASEPENERKVGCTPCLMFGEEGQQHDFFEKMKSKPASVKDNQSTVKGCCVASEPEEPRNKVLTPCLMYGEDEQDEYFFDDIVAKPASVGANHHSTAKGCTISVDSVPQEARNHLCSPCLMFSDEDQQEIIQEIESKPAFVEADEVGTITDASFDETLTTFDDTRTFDDTITNTEFHSTDHNSSRQKVESSWSCPAPSCCGQSDEYKYDCANEYDYDYRRYANCAHYEDDDTFGSLRDEFPAAFPNRKRSEFEFPNYHPDQFKRLMKCRNSCRPTSPTDWIY